MDVSLAPAYLCLYQSGFAIVGVGEDCDALLDDALQWLAFPPLLAEDGDRLTIRDVEDRTHADAPRGEVAGNLYIRRCSLALAEAVQARGTVPWTIRADGVADLGGGEA